MHIQFNTDNNIKGSEKLQENLSDLISGPLDRFSAQITRLEVHLTDENSNKQGQNDKRCMLEARLEGMQPVAVSNQADSLEEAVRGAVDKLKSSLSSTIGKLRNY